MKLFKLACRHQFYINDIHRFSDEVVGGLCLKCGGVYHASCGLDLPGELVGYRMKPCSTCEGTGKVKDTLPFKPEGSDK